MTAFVLLMAGMHFYYNFSIVENLIFSLAISLLATMAEAVSPNGFDNISIPLVLSLGLALLA
jgi:hypothetical protein